MVFYTQRLYSIKLPEVTDANIQDGNQDHLKDEKGRESVDAHVLHIHSGRIVIYVLANDFRLSIECYTRIWKAKKHTSVPNIAEGIDEGGKTENFRVTSDPHIVDTSHPREINPLVSVD